MLNILKYIRVTIIWFYWLCSIYYNILQLKKYDNVDYVQVYCNVFYLVQIIYSWWLCLIRYNAVHLNKIMMLNIFDALSCIEVELYDLVDYVQCIINYYI